MKVVAAIFTIKVFVRICYVRPCIWEWATYPHYFGSINKLLQTKSFSHLFSHFRPFCVERNIWIFASYKEPKIVKVPDKDKWYAGSVISYQLKQPSEPHRPLPAKAAALLPLLCHQLAREIMASKELRNTLFEKNYIFSSKFSHQLNTFALEKLSFRNSPTTEKFVQKLAWRNNLIEKL